MAELKECFYLMEQIRPGKYKCLYVHLTRSGASDIMERMWKQDSYRQIEVWNSEHYSSWVLLSPRFGEGLYGS